MSYEAFLAACQRFLDHAHGEATLPNALEPVAPQVEPNPGSLDGCYCSDRMSGGVPCPPGKCPNVPKRQAPQVEPGQAELAEDLLACCRRLTKERDEARAGRFKGSYVEEVLAKLSASQAEVERLTKEHGAVGKRGAQYERNAELVEQLSASQERVKALENIAEQFGQKNSELSAENARLAKELAEHVAANQELMRRNAGLTRQRDELASKWKRARCVGCSSTRIGADAAPDAPQPIVVGQMWRNEVNGRICVVNAIDSEVWFTYLSALSEAGKYPEEFRRDFTWLSDPPPQPIPAGEGGA